LEEVVVGEEEEEEVVAMRTRAFVLLPNVRGQKEAVTRSIMSHNHVCFMLFSVEKWEGVLYGRNREKTARIEERGREGVMIVSLHRDQIGG
jgi:hypothetical protein